MPNEFIARNGIISKGNVVVTGSVTATGGIITSGSLIHTGSLNISGSLDVTGTGRFGSNVTITGSATNSLLVKGSGTTSATNALLVQDSAGNSNIQVADDHSVTFTGTGSPNQTTWKWQNAAETRTVTISGGNLDITSSGIIAGGTLKAGNLTLTYTTISGFNQAQLDLNGDNVILNSRQNTASPIRILSGNGGATSKGTVYISDYSNLSTSVNSSAALQVDSVVQGFLPPRTNLTSNISSPAQGLQTYITASATEGLYYYNSGSYQGWTKVLNNSGSQVISGSLELTSALTASNAIITGNVTVLGTASIGTLIVNQTQLSTGSNQLGDNVDDFQTLYGTVRIPTGSLTVTGSTSITGSFTVSGRGNTNIGDIGYSTINLNGGVNVSNTGPNTGTSLTVSGGGNVAMRFDWDNINNVTSAVSSASRILRFTGASQYQVRGSGTTSATTAFQVQNANASSSLQILDDGTATITNNNTASLQVINSNTSNVSSSAIYASARSGTGTGGIAIGVYGTSISGINGYGGYFVANGNGNASRTYVGVYGSSVVASSNTTQVGGSFRVEGGYTSGSVTGVLSTVDTITAGGTNHLYRGVLGTTTNYYVDTTGSGYFANNILIGTTSSLGYKLNVSGSGNFTSNLTVTGSLTVLGGITGSFSGSGTITSASYALTASYVDPLNQNVLVTGSLLISRSSAGDVINITPNASDNAIVINNSGFIKFASGTDSYIRGSSTTFNILDASFVSKVQFHWGGNPSWINTGGDFIVGATSGLSAKLGVKGSGTTSSTTALLVQNANASASLAVLDNGNIGVGTTAPGAKLEIRATGSNETTQRWLDNAGNLLGDFAELGNAGVLRVGYAVSAVSTARPLITLDGGSGNSTAAISLRSKSGTTNIKIASDIGSYISGSNLALGYISGTAPAVLSISGSASETLLKVDSAASQNILFISGSGNVGIGTSSPAYKLDVSGSVRVMGTNKLNFGGTGSADAVSWLNYDGTDNLQITHNVTNRDIDFNVNYGGTLIQPVSIISYNDPGLPGLYLKSVSALSNNSAVLQIANGGTVQGISGTGMTFTAGNTTIFRGYQGGSEYGYNFKLIGYNAGAFGGGYFTYSSRLPKESGVDTERFRLHTNGNFGFYNSNPQAIIDVNGNVKIKGTGTTNSTTALLVQNANASASLVVLDNGNIGIGTTAPDVPLHVSSSNTILGRFQNNATSAVVQVSAIYENIFRAGANSDNSEFWYDSGYATTYIDNNYPNAGASFNQYGDIRFRRKLDGTNLSTVMTIRGNNGNVGIGTTSPAYKLDVSGSGNFTNNLTVTGSFTVVTGSTVEFQVNQTGVKIGNATTDSHSITGSVSISSSFSTSGSALTVYKSGSTVVDIQGSQGQLFSVIDSLTGSLMSVNDVSGLPILEVFSNDTVVMGTYGAPGLTVSGSTVAISASLLSTTQTGSLPTGSNLIYTVNTGSYTAGFFDYYVTSGSNYRAGNIMAVWGASSIKFTDLATPDIGSTANLQFSMSLSASSAQLFASASSAGWTVKTLFRTI